MRLIDADALMSKFVEFVRASNNSDFATVPRWNDAVSLLESAPTIEAEPRWIPCGERLPEIGEHYVSDPCIVYANTGAYAFAILEENIFGQVGWDCERDDEYHESIGEVVAWLPLPDPYKVDEVNE